MDIRVIEDNTGLAPRGERYSAIDNDTYDGAPDGNRTHGIGATPAEAVNDLLDLLLEDGEICHDEARDLLEAMGISRYRDPDMAREDMADREAALQSWDE